MAIYHLSIKVIGRSHGRSAVSAAAYRSGEKLLDHESGILHDYTRKGGVIMSEILLPENAPREYADRENLWNEVHTIEKSANAQLAREIEIALPNEISREDQIQCVREYINDNFINAGMVADWALHDKGDGNPHVHILLTMRQFKPDGTWDVKKRNQYVLDENGNKIPVIDKKTGEQKVEKKTGRKVWQRQTVEVNDWNDQSKAEQWRKAWADCVNTFLSKEQHIEHRSFERQGIDKEPTIHEGYVARQMEAKGKISNRCEENREIRKRNKLKEWIDKKIHSLTEKIKSIKKEMEELIYGRINDIIESKGDPEESGISEIAVGSEGNRLQESVEGNHLLEEPIRHENLGVFGVAGKMQGSQTGEHVLAEQVQHEDVGSRELGSQIQTEDIGGFDLAGSILGGRHREQEMEAAVPFAGNEYRDMEKAERGSGGRAGQVGIGAAELNELEHLVEGSSLEEFLDDLAASERASEQNRDHHISERQDRELERQRSRVEEERRARERKPEPEKHHIRERGHSR